MQAIFRYARAAVAARGHAVLALGLIVGLTGGVVLAAVAGARRTSTALDRLLDHTKAPHISVGAGPEHPGTLPFDRIRRLPMVEATGTLSYVFLSIEGLGPDELVVPFAAGDREQFRTIERGALVAGRRPDPGSSDEIAISPKLQRRHGWRPGTRIRAQLAGPKDLHEAIRGEDFFPLEGPSVSLRVAGVLRQPEHLTASPDDQRVIYLGGSQSIYLTQGFFERHVRPLFGDPVGIRVRLRNGPADIPAFRAALAAMPEARGLGVDEASLQDAQARNAINLQASALLVFALLAALALFVIAGQSLARHVRHDSADHVALRAMGMTNPQLVAVAAIHGAVIGAIASVIAAAFAALLSPMTIFGLAREAEPEPGFDIDPQVLLAGASAIMVLTVGRAALTGVRATREIDRGIPRAATRGVSPVAHIVRLLGASPAAAAGVRTALTPQRGARSVPVTGSLASAVVAVAALVASVGFGASLDRVAESPASYGWNWDVIVGSPNNVDTYAETVPRLAESESVGSFAPVALGAGLRVGGEVTPVLGVDITHGSVFPVMTHGVPPTGPDEIALGTSLARRLGLGLGDTVAVSGDAQTMRMKVSGITVRGGDQTAATSGGGVPGEGALMSLNALRRLAPETPVNLYLVRFAPGATAQAAARELDRTFPGYVLHPIRPAAIENVTRIRWIPYALSGVLALLGLATLSHTLLTAVRRRAPELAILKAIGFVRRQVVTTVAWHASATVVVALVIGVPLGIAGGRWSWRFASDAMGVPFHAVTPLLALAGGAVAAILLANAIAAVPGAIAARIAPAVALRHE